MTLETYLEKLEGLPFSMAISEGAFWFPTLESIHVVAITLVLGSIAIVDLRLLGFQSHRKSAQALIAELLPYTWGAFVVAVISGALMFCSNATLYADNILFLFKLGFLALAGINMAFFHRGAFTRINTWDTAAPPPTSVRLSGAISLSLWISITFLGRFMGFI